MSNLFPHKICCRRLDCWSCAVSGRAFEDYAHRFGRKHPSIAAARQGLNIPRLIRRVAERNPQPTNSRMDAVFKLNHGIVGPKSFLNLAALYYFPGTLKQHSQNLERLLGQLDLLPLL